MDRVPYGQHHHDDDSDSDDDDDDDDNDDNDDNDNDSDDNDSDDDDDDDNEFARVPYWPGGSSSSSWSYIMIFKGSNQISLIVMNQW